MSEYQGVLVFGEAKEGKLTGITAELLGGGRGLASDLGQELACLIAGSGIENLAQEAIALGADKVYLVDDPLLKEYQTDSYATVGEKVAKQAMPQVLLLGNTDMGRDLAPRLAFRLDTVVSTDCVALGIDPDSKLLLQTKPVYGGNAQAVFTTESYPQMATVRVKSMSPLERDDSRQGEIVKVEAGLDPKAIRTKILETVPEEVEGIKMEDAAVVVAGGRGIGSAEGFKKLEDLAAMFKGAVGASRPPCDNGWVAAGYQVGLTGKIISPDLYIAVAISGSSQHMTGCTGAKSIIAINKDPESNIVKQARYAVIGDWKKVLPAFTEKVKELLSK